MSNRKSAHLILGVPYGAPEKDVSRAFARAVRRLRSDVTGRFDLEDLNWALHQLEQVTEAPDVALDDFRVPADPSVYELPEAYGILNPPARRYPRRSPPSDAATMRRVHDALIVEIAEKLRSELRGTDLPAIHTVK